MRGREGAASGRASRALSIQPPLDCASVSIFAWLAERSALATRLSRMTHRVLFVCLGNICRSPLAEAAFRVEAARLGLAVEADSAGTGGWHRGEPPDRRAVAAAGRNGVDISDLRARQVRSDDFERFDHILALDGDNLADLAALQPAGSRAR